MFRNERDPKDLSEMLANVPPLPTMAAVDAWIESCKQPHVTRSPGLYTEEQWAAH